MEGEHIPTIIQLIRSTDLVIIQLEDSPSYSSIPTKPTNQSARVLILVCPSSVFSGDASCFSDKRKEPWNLFFSVEERPEASSEQSLCKFFHQWAFSLASLSHELTLDKQQRKWRRGSIVKATWLFNKGNNERETGASLERCEAANEDILIFFFQLDLATQVQCALNLEQYDVAQQLRNKLTEVETEIVRQREAIRGSSSKSEAQDKAINLLILRADLKKAIEKEKYALAAELRDQISKLEAESLAASAKALAYENVQYAFRLGQKIRHKMFGYRAIICGTDPVCCESSSWMEIAQVDKLLQGPNQPFYQVLVDVHADPNLLVAYVPEENLLASDQPDTDRFDHPYISFLFYGMDSSGDFIPVKQLREKYNRPRHEVPVDMNDDDGSKNT